ncbi:MAG: hypothetical protein ACOYMG_01885 [Candidatus Methylumidiphilus sp.]
MSTYLDVKNFPSASADDAKALARSLAALLAGDFKGDMLALLGGYRQILGDNKRREEWDGIHGKLKTLFMCGKSVPIDGPMIGVSLSIRDSDYFQETAKTFGHDRSILAHIEWMATLWNTTFGSTGLWMGKTFEPVTQETFAAKCGRHPITMNRYDASVARIGRNFFREPAGHKRLQSIGLPVLTQFWGLEDRPAEVSAQGFDGQLLEKNLEKEKAIPYVKTGGIFLSLPGESAVAEMNGKPVYQLNYRWPELHPAFPMTRLIDELVQVADGVYLGQLVMATHHYSLGTLRQPLFGEIPPQWESGEAYAATEDVDYGYQNNGFFLMIDTAHAKQAYADAAFPYLRPRQGEQGYVELGYDTLAHETAPARAVRPSSEYPQVTDWVSGWGQDEALSNKFTTFCLEPSPKGEEGDVRELLRPGESILQMLQRIQGEISSASSHDDHLRHFEKLNRLFRRGIAPSIVDGVFQGQGKGYNTRFDAPEKLSWYGGEEPCTGFDYYHGATLNLHFGFGDSFVSNIANKLSEHEAIPSALAHSLEENPRGPNVLNAVWANIGRFIFPWAGKSFERVSGRKLSMLLDESDDLEARYPERVGELKSHPASLPHYDLVKKNRDHFWQEPGLYAAHLDKGSWGRGMPEADREFWRNEAAAHWVFGNNIQDARILATDGLLRILDMNYHPPVPSIQRLADSGPSPFVRQGYIFLGVDGRESILPMNNANLHKKKVFQFHYRYPLVGGPAPIGTCLDELVELAQGLFLGQLIYSTAPFTPFHSSTDPAEYQYQLFGYFLLLDNTWETHRQAIGFDINT